MTLAATLEARLRRELAEARVALAPMLEEPFYQANSIPGTWGATAGTWSDLAKRPWGPVPALFQNADGEWWGAGVVGHVEHVATCGETLELLEKYAPDVAEYEARAMTLAGDLFVLDADARAAWLEGAAEVWPWTRAGGLGSLPDILPMLVGNLADLVRVVRDGVDNPSRAARAWAPVEHADAIARIAEALERREAGRGDRYRAWCDGSALVRVHSEIGADGEIMPSAHLEPRRTAFPAGIGEIGQLVLGTANKGAGDLVTGEQLSWLYWTSLPPGMRHARVLWRDVERIYRGDLSRLLERIAPLALNAAEGEDTREARGELATAVLRHVTILHERLRLDGTPPATEAQADELVGSLSKGFADYVAPMGERGKILAASVRESSAARANASADERWKLWRSEPGREPRWLVELAVVVWFHEAKRDLEKRARTPVGASLPVARLVANVLQRGATIQHNEARQLDILLDRNEHVIATFEPGPTTAGFTIAALERLREKTKLLSTLDAYALIHFLAAQAREHHVSGGDFVVETEGFPGLARRLGLYESDAHERLRNILDVLQQLRGEYFGVEIAGFVGYVHDGARGQRGSVLRTTILEPLRPGFGAWLEGRLGKTASSAKEARMVVPLVGLPPLFGRRNDYALQAGAALEASIYLRQRAPEIVERGGVAIPRGEWERIADRAGYARRYLGRTVDKLLGAWLTPPAGNPRPAFLELVAPGLYNFGPVHEEAREALAEAGRRTIKGTLQGEATARGKVGGPRRRRRK